VAGSSRHSRSQTAFRTPAPPLILVPVQVDGYDPQSASCQLYRLIELAAQPAARVA